jgi:hypothetical protein
MRLLELYRLPNQSLRLVEGNRAATIIPISTSNMITTPEGKNRSGKRGRSSFLRPRSPDVNARCSCQGPSDRTMALEWCSMRFPWHGPRSWCCPSFEAHFQSGGKRGISVSFKLREAGTVRPFLCFRSIDKEHESSAKSPVPITVEATAPITYCPWCGRNALRWYRRSTSLAG